MPTYTFRRKSTGEEWDEFCSFSEHDTMLQDPDIEQVPCAPAIVGGVGGMKTDSGFNDILKNIKKRSGKNNTVNTR